VYSPAPERPDSRYAAIAEELRSRPGEWGVVYEGSRRLAAALSTHIRTGGVTAFAPGGAFDACARVRGDRRTVYARFLGDGEG
jgi:hypothetical protein